MVKAIEKHITFYEAHDEVLKHIMETQPTVKTILKPFDFYV